jgi:hypothetical protein
MGDINSKPAEQQAELPFDSVYVVSPSEIVPAIQKARHESIQISLDRLAAQGYFIVKRKTTA